MTIAIIEKWKALQENIEFFKKGNSICGKADIEQAEKELGFKFPIGYNEFCTVFGSGSLGTGNSTEFFRIYCPTCPPSIFDIRQSGHNLIGVKLDFDVSGLAETDESYPIITRLLEFGYPFADSDVADKFFWDLTSYRDEDQSYDIYWIPDEGVDEVTLIGRDFFEFIDKFCLGEGLKIMFPDEDFPPTYKTSERKFSGYEKIESAYPREDFAEFILKTFWEDHFANDKYLTKGTEVEISCSYDVSNKSKADQLQNLWMQERDIEISIIEPSIRHYIPRMVEIKVRKIRSQLNKESVEKYLEKMIEIGKKCDCNITGFGFGIKPETLINSR